MTDLINVPCKNTVPEEIKGILYSAINEIGKEKIRMEVIADIERSVRSCNEILEKCKRNLGSDFDNDETLGLVCEGMLHFMMTASMLPSERKVDWKGAALDVVVPSLRMLSKSPNKALVIQIIKKETDFAKIKQAESVQALYENIWIVSARGLKIDHKNYYIGSANYPYCRIISDIQRFLIQKRYRGLKLLHG
jgi:hypothetical protein